ncbi:low molecular weight protein tyrosine phosphatase family protein [Novipirellula artificiosorum]|uniref:Low molecular weight phosphotyrosine protein phosphatase n=1 Tax=Novipirellula artificiosorum TaxID=2528016 RepID=A0A5C6DWF5_9BACT|nr:protein tyrosine phosphatase [Novipirellula artificiosorum]TWU39386.1 Low molecular weight phosphotyrosine protein phosphatase [Novipirellula artificiosorum]
MTTDNRVTKDRIVIRPNVLFVCSKNQWRSPTAEAIYRNDDRISVRSRGTSRSAVQTIRASDIVWADAVLVMEVKHQQRILADFPGESKFKPLHVLDIPDDYQFMDNELVELIKSAAEMILDELAEAI